MEYRGDTPRHGIAAEEVPELAAVLASPGPFATVYLSTPAAVENAAQIAEQPWRAARDELERAGAPAAVADAIGALVPGAHLEGRALAVVADSSGVLLTRREAEPIDRDVARWAPLPSLGPVLEWQQSRIPHLVVLADRVGADIALFLPDGATGLSSVGGTDASDPLLHRSKPGGWSQRRFQERAENTWEANAAQVADRVATLAELTGARLVVVAGDVHAARFLTEHLPDRLADLVVEIEGQRAAGVDFDAVADDVVKLVATRVAEDTVELLQKLREELGQNDRAVEGVGSTLDALTAAQVDTLLVHDDPSDEREVWFATEGSSIAGDRATLEGYGAASPAKGRLVDAMIRSTLLTGARVRVVPSTVARDGVGALLRF
ncbi:MAG TPA: Vms1/Ankzf1 family peptidyl-tRNA hydrolase [Acidimicrobiales bacterium]|nr:Vms1/Ankzf1 family peptidyl-tRNA hydrolase [Acidimicrobiales bacterium]